MSSIKLKNIYKAYKNSKDYAVTDFNLDISDKEFIVFVGPSGCGKSTTLRMIAGLEEISEGELYIDGELMNDVAPKDRNISMVFQNYALYPHMTVRENLEFGLKSKKVDKNIINQRVEESSKLLGLENLMDRKPANLSGGQQQRVALGRAVVRESGVFLMDEPLSNLDAKLRVQMRTEISKLHDRLEATIIYVTHDQTEAMTLASRIVVMYDGVIQQVGTPTEVYDDPENIFVAGFIGSPPMNFIQAKFKDGYVENQYLGRLKVTEPHNKLLIQKGFNGRNITFGVRPEDFHSENIYLETFVHSKIIIKPQVTEFTGSEVIVYSSIGQDSVVIKLDKRERGNIGSEIELAVDMNKAIFFDPNTELNINRL